MTTAAKKGAVYDPTTALFTPVDAGSASVGTLLFLILVELRIMNQQLQASNHGHTTETDDLDNMRADQVIEPNFFQSRNITA